MAELDHENVLPPSAALPKTQSTGDTIAYGIRIYVYDVFHDRTGRINRGSCENGKGCQNNAHLVSFGHGENVGYPLVRSLDIRGTVHAGEGGIVD